MFLVWPKGHPAIPRIAEFPEIRNPHIELYRGFGSGYDVTAAGAYIVGGKPPPGIPRGGFFIACTNYGNPVTKGTVPKPSVTITKETAVKCTLPASPVTDIVFRKQEASPTSTCTQAHCSLHRDTSPSRAQRSPSRPGTAP